MLAAVTKRSPDLSGLTQESFLFHSFHSPNECWMGNLPGGISDDCGCPAPLILFCRTLGDSEGKKQAHG